MWHKSIAWFPVWAEDTKRWVWAWPWHRVPVWKIDQWCPDWASPETVCLTRYREKTPIEGLCTSYRKPV